MTVKALVIAGGGSGGNWNGGGGGGARNSGDTGTRTVTWFSGIKWAGGSAPTLTTTINKIDTIGIRVITAGSAYYGYVVGQNL